MVLSAFLSGTEGYGIGSWLWPDYGVGVLSEDQFNVRVKFGTIQVEIKPFFSMKYVRFFKVMHCSSILGPPEPKPAPFDNLRQPSFP